MSNIIELSQMNSFEKYSQFIQQAEVLGKGTYGKVYKAYVNNIFPIAVKIIELDKKRIQEQKKAFKDENDFLMSITHPNIMKVYFHFARIDAKLKENQYYVGMEYLPQDLESLLNENINFTTNEIANMAQQLQNGLTYLQSKNIAHRDLKPANILKSEDGTYKLCDFSEIKFSNDAINTVTQTLHGTPNYLEPKLYQVYLKILEDKSKKRPLNYNVKYNPIKADVFSFGLIILQCLMGSTEDQIIGANQSEEGMKYLINNNFTDSYKWFLKLCLNYDEKQRWSFEKMNQIFKLNLIEAAYQLEVKDIQLVERDNLIAQLKNDINKLKQENQQIKQSQQLSDEYAKTIQSQQLELLQLKNELKKKQEDFVNSMAQNLTSDKKNKNESGYKQWTLKKLELSDEEIRKLCVQNQKLWKNESQDKRKALVKKNSNFTWNDDNDDGYNNDGYDDNDDVYYDDDVYYRYNNDVYYNYNDDNYWNSNDDHKYKAIYFSSENGNHTYSFVDKDLPKALEMLQKLIRESGHAFKNCLKILHSNLWNYEESLSQLTKKMSN